MKKKISILVILLSMITLNAGEVKETFNKKCAMCHGEDGKGQTKMGQKFEIRDYTDIKVQDSMKDEEIFKAIKNGYKQMKPFVTLTDDEIKALVKYTREFVKK